MGDARLAAAPTLWAIVAARAVQGAFAGLIGPVVLAGVAAAVLAAHRGRALGLMAAVAPLGAVLGPAAGGLLAGTPRDATATVGGVSALARWLGFALGPALGALCWTVSGGGMPAVRAGLVAALAVTTIAAACCLAISGRIAMPIAREAGAAGLRAAGP